MAKTKIRADQLAADLGLAESRERAKRLIMAGQIVYYEHDIRRPVDKPGRQFTPDTVLELVEQERFVSRGGYKLLTGLEAFQLDVTGAVCLDAGASTGGFTDCLLQHGAARVYAVDVGRGQLHEKLLADERVISMEKVNLRLAGPDLLPEPVNVVVSDVSFISLTKVLPAIVPMMASHAEMVVLVKPQFELGPEAVIKGVVRDEAKQQEAIELVRACVENALGLVWKGCVPSKIKGPKGNQEYLAWIQKQQ
ncbi:TlyA family RNA methyltransferase [Desulfovibrio inopinatus]|uniref:TlyA family RNA methyltransferase n=1 Tax=Desulfovibrio inopinatus TaxID=102109 RepID=UPI0004187355|nr:TlyA family RNA methyltransferase [Desulfovibrio inopinatus]